MSKRSLISAMRLVRAKLVEEYPDLQDPEEHIPGELVKVLTDALEADAERGGLIETASDVDDWAEETGCTVNLTRRKRSNPRWAARIFRPQRTQYDDNPYWVGYGGTIAAAFEEALDRFTRDDATDEHL